MRQTLTLELKTLHDDKRPVYISGNFNHWHARDEKYRLTRLNKGKYKYTFSNEENLPFPLVYKYTKGSWEEEEVNQEGRSVQNRRIEMPQNLVKDIVPRWRGENYNYNVSYLPIIEVVNENFEIPQLDKHRRIAIILPHNYYKSSKKYPVMYLHDGQNLIDPQAPYGCWKLDHRMARLAQKGMGDFIIVAIDHGGKDRLKEYVPFDTPRWGVGDGKKYVRFLAETLKPFVDKHYRTLTDRENTGIGGSSLGGLISIYAGTLYPQVFSKMMIFSPSLWIAPKIYLNTIHFTDNYPMRIYVYVGAKESDFMVPQAQHFKEMIEKKGLDKEKIRVKLKVNPLGRHNEGEWGKAFPKAMRWLWFDEN
ncbi:MAG: alpha/beta hydrolase [Bacteroidetes bacterium]|nr:alpha/beta hydrolase [Bacteroidota bacterium]